MSQELFSEDLLKNHLEPVIYGYYDRADMQGTTSPQGWHRHKVYEIMYVNRGKAQIWVEEGKMTLHNHQFMLLNARAWHRLSLEGKNFSMINIEFGFRPAAPGGLSLKRLTEKSQGMKKFTASPEPFLILNDPDESILSLLKQTVALADSKHPYSQALTTTLTGMLLILLAKGYEEEKINEKQRVFNPVLNEAIGQIQRGYEKDLSLASLAQAQKVHPRYLSALFKEYLGLSPAAYLCQVRLKKAEELLLSCPDSVMDIGTRVGFNSQQYFIKCFKSRYGFTPGACRKKT